ncbi:MAG: EamA family transporter [Syntrophomonadaceae bacterium]
MEWIILALLSPAAYAVVNFVDKYIVSGGVADSSGMPFYSAIVAVFFGTVYWSVFHPPIHSSRLVGMVLLAGILTNLSTALYFRVISREAASRIIIWLQLVPALVLPMSTFFLREAITLIQIYGFVTVLFAAICLNLSLTSEGISLKLSRASLGQILLADCLLAVSMVLLKAATESAVYPAVIVLESWGIGLGAVVLCLIYPTGLKVFMAGLRNAGKRDLSLIFINETGLLAGKLIGILALTMGPVSLVSVLGSTQVFFGLVLGNLTPLLKPDIFQEDASQLSRLRDFAMAFLMFFGVWMIYV